MNLSLTLQAVARRLPDHPAITDSRGTIDYATFEQRVAAMAGGLRAFVPTPGARVAIAMENAPEFLISLYALWRAGLVPVPMNARLHPREMAFILENSHARLCLASPAQAATLAPALAGMREPPPVFSTSSDEFQRLGRGAPVRTVDSLPTDEAWLFYTSGTTGRPKGAVLTNRSLLFMSHAYYADIDQLDERDTILHAAPLSHGSGLYAIPHIARGSHNVILGGSFDPEQVLDAFSRYTRVSMFAAPTMVTRLLQAPRAATADTRGLRTLIYGGAAMYVADLKRALAMLGPKLCQIYGQGESPMTITAMSKAMHLADGGYASDERLGSTGLARTGVEVMVVDETGRPQSPGEVGEIVTRSDCLMQGYWGNPDATAKAIRGGWLWTGDVGTLDPAGFLTIKDRSKDMIISGGSNIYPREIEEVLLTHAAVLEVAVIGAPHAEWGEETVAFVVPRPGRELSESELDQLCLAHIARYKRPRRYVWAESLPKNNYGKILKTELRASLASRD
ncbi:MAG: AMP-binding protein [Hyphomicrobiaceae bacterium]